MAKILIIFLTFGILACGPLPPLAPSAKPKEEAKTEERPEEEEVKRKPGTKDITGTAAWDNVLSPWLGTPYSWGGNTKKGVDCSGFTKNVYSEKERRDIPRTAAEQSKIGTAVSSQKSLQIGDLVFFGDAGKVSHVGLYVGGGRFMHASSSRGVMVSPLTDSYWYPRYIKARRPK